MFVFGVAEGFVGVEADLMETASEGASLNPANPTVPSCMIPGRPAQLSGIQRSDAGGTSTWDMATLKET
ncbi:unnamed protein product [Gadus morhua 'NCC']